MISQGKSWGQKYSKFSTKAKKNYAECQYGPDDFLMFGPETRGIPVEIQQSGIGTPVRIPMGREIRSLNLSILWPSPPMRPCVNRVSRSYINNY